MTTTAPPGATTGPGLGSCLLVANPAAAGVTADVVARIEAALAGSPVLAPGAPIRRVWTGAPGHATELVRGDATADLVVAVGGDGTVNEVTRALAVPGRTGPALCVLPAGSGNSTSRSLWGDRGWPEVVDLLTANPADGVRVRRIDLLRLREPGLVSVLGTSTGFLAQVLVDLARVDPALAGIDRYFAAAAGVLQDMPAHPTRVLVDGRVLSEGPTSSVAVGGGRHRAYSFQFLPRSELDDGLLDVSTIAAVSGPEAEELAALIPTGDHLDRPEVTYARGREVVIERTDGRPLVAEYDGSLLPDPGSRLTVEVLPDALTVLAATDPGE
jgi:diacylglycerol kinase (ATP)